MKHIAAFPIVQVAASNGLLGDALGVHLPAISCLQSAACMHAVACNTSIGGFQQAYHSMLAFTRMS
jgi:hypothetical protein